MKNGTAGTGGGNGGAKALLLSDLVDKLVRLGMSRDEALVYVRLQDLGPSRAGAVADALGITRQNAYRTFERMAAHGFATPSMARPRLYSAAQPATVIQLLHGRLEALENEFDDALTQTVPSLEALRGLRVEHPPHVHFTLLRGLDAIVQQAQQMCRDAESQVAGLFADPLDRPLVTSVAKLDVASGLHARVLVAKKAAPLTSLVSAPAQLRVVDRDPLATSIVVDERECLVLVSPERGKKRGEPAIAYRTNAPGVVTLQQAAFEGIWTVGQPVTH
jgi:sugar-specific transcriptional regulator TrmB